MKNGVYNMKMIIGLGNPGKEYAQTKHNVGFMVVDAIADELNVSVETSPTLSSPPGRRIEA